MIAAANTNRNSIGIDIDHTYIEQAFNNFGSKVKSNIHELKIEEGAIHEK